MCQGKRFPFSWNEETSTYEPVPGPPGSDTGTPDSAADVLQPGMMTSEAYASTPLSGSSASGADTDILESGTAAQALSMPGLKQHASADIADQSVGGQVKKPKVGCHPCLSSVQSCWLAQDVNPLLLSVTLTYNWALRCICCVMLADVLCSERCNLLCRHLWLPAVPQLFCKSKPLLVAHLPLCFMDLPAAQSTWMLRLTCQGLCARLACC